MQYLTAFRLDCVDKGQHNNCHRCEGIEITPIFLVRSAKNTFSGVLQNFSHSLMCARRWRGLRIVAMIQPLFWGIKTEEKKAKQNERWRDVGWVVWGQVLDYKMFLHHCSRRELLDELRTFVTCACNWDTFSSGEPLLVIPLSGESLVSADQMFFVIWEVSLT